MDGKKTEEKQINMVANRGTCRIQSWEVFQVASPQVHHIADKNGFTDSKNPDFINRGIRATIVWAI